MSEKNAFYNAVEKPVETPQETINRLTALSLLEYEQCRKDEAKRLGFRPSMLDKATGKEKQEQVSVGGKPLVIEDCEQWHEAVNNDVLDKVLRHIQEHMHIEPYHAVVSVLWLAHTHMYKSFSHTPRLIITAPEPECGKSVLLVHMIGNLVNKPLSTDSITPAVFFRVSEQCEPTFLIDEGELFIKQDSEIIGSLNNGWESVGGALRCTGENHQVCEFPTHAPVAMAGIKLEGKLPPATVSRSLVIELERDCGEILKPWDRDKHKSGLLLTRKKLARWIDDNKDAIKNSKPCLPHELKNRMLDKWKPLFKIAEIAGSHWQDMVIDAYNHFSGNREPSKTEFFLMDLQEALPAKGNIHTDTLINELYKHEDSKYTDYNFKAYDPEKRKIQPMQLSKLLKPYGIKPMSVKVNNCSKKGYKSSALQAIFKRYISEKKHFSPKTGFLGGTPALPSCGAASSRFLGGTLDDEVPSRKALKPASGGESAGVPPRNPINGEKEKKQPILIKKPAVSESDKDCKKDSRYTV